MPLSAPKLPLRPAAEDQPVDRPHRAAGSRSFFTHGYSQVTMDDLAADWA